MQTATQLQEEFSLPDQLVFDEPFPGMARARISTAACAAELYLHGGHLVHWQPTGQHPVLFLSGRSAFVPGKAIRGGVPVVFPWFGAADRSPVHPPEGSPSHGFARTSLWTLRFAAMAGDDVHLSLTLDQGEGTAHPDFAGLQLGLDLTLGTSLSLQLSVANTDREKPVLFEEALHAYFAVGDVQTVRVAGLGGTEYLDKTDNFDRKRQDAPDIHFQGETDRPYLHTAAPVTLIDPVLRRRIQLTKSNSNTTVIWNPGETLAATLKDLAPDTWSHFICMETANVAEDAVRLAGGQAHTMGMRVEVLPL